VDLRHNPPNGNQKKKPWEKVLKEQKLAKAKLHGDRGFVKQRGPTEARKEDIGKRNCGKKKNSTGIRELTKTGTKGVVKSQGGKRREEVEKKSKEVSSLLKKKKTNKKLRGKTKPWE